MSKCSVVGCKNPPIGGVQEIIAAGHLQDPNATLLGLRTIWCAEHEDALAGRARLKRIRELSRAELNEDQA